MVAGEQVHTKDWYRIDALRKYTDEGNKGLSVLPFLRLECR